MGSLERCLHTLSAANLVEGNSAGSARFLVDDADRHLSRVPGLSLHSAANDRRKPPPSESLVFPFKHDFAIGCALLWCELEIVRLAISCLGTSSAWIVIFNHRDKELGELWTGPAKERHHERLVFGVRLSIKHQNEPPRNWLVCSKKKPAESTPRSALLEIFPPPLGPSVDSPSSHSQSRRQRLRAFGTRALVEGRQKDNRNSKVNTAAKKPCGWRSGP